MLAPMPNTTPDAPTTAPTSGIRLPTLLAYSLPMIAVNFSLVLFMSYVNIYAIDVLLVPAAAMGLIFGLEIRQVHLLQRASSRIT